MGTLGSTLREGLLNSNLITMESLLIHPRHVKIWAYTIRVKKVTYGGDNK